MKLDESIELINKKKNINEMNNLTNLSVSEMRNCMHEMMTDDNMSGCLYEVLTQEGFLPETLAEGEDYGTHCETMMEDDMIAEEMYKACASNMSECGSKMYEFINASHNTSNNEGVEMGEAKGWKSAIHSQLKHCIEHGHSYEQSKKHVADAVKGWDLSMEDYLEAKKEFGKTNEGTELEEGGEGSRYMFFSNLEQIKNQAEQLLALDHDKIEAMLNSGHDWAADHIATSKETLDHAFDFITNEMGGEATADAAPMPAITVMGSEEEPMMEASDDDDDEDSPTYLINKKRVLDQEIAKFNGYVNKFIPMIDKLDSAAMNQYFNTELRATGDYSADEFKNFLTKDENESSVEYYDKVSNSGSGYGAIFSALVEPRKRGFFAKYEDSIEPNVLETMEDTLSDIFDKKNEIYTKKADIEKIEGSIEDRRSEKDLDRDVDFDASSPKIEKNIDDILTADELGLYDDETLEEGNLPDFKPVVGKNVQSTNKSDSDASEKESLEDAEDSQETTEEKVDNLKHQKFADNPNMESEFEKDIRDVKQLGAFNPLNYDFQNDVPQSYKKRVELEVTTGHSRERDEKTLGKEANIDQESTKRTGEKLLAASKANQGERDDMFKANPIIVTDDPYQPTSITGKHKDIKRKPGGGDLNESEMAEIERMKKMFGYEKELVNENKKPTELNENEILFKSISDKKFI